MKKKILASLSVLAVMAWLGAVPATAEEVSNISEAPALAAAPAPGGCAPAFDLASLTQTGGVCPVVNPEPAAPPPHPIFLRTCVCSCGYPCKTDADCGPGGRCGPGITCC